MDRITVALWVKSNLFIRCEAAGGVAVLVWPLQILLNSDDWFHLLTVLIKRNNTLSESKVWFLFFSL